VLTAREHLAWSAATDLRTGLTRQLEWHAALRVPAGLHDRSLLPSLGG
jgi:hypothetical protein